MNGNKQGKKKLPVFIGHDVMGKPEGKKERGNLDDAGVEGKNIKRDFKIIEWKWRLYYCDSG